MVINNIVVGDFMAAIRAARMPFQSFDRIDSYYTHSNDNGIKWDTVHIGKNDLALLQNLVKAGDSDAKFMREIDVSVEITAPVYWLQELDTYKIGTVRNSSSLQHIGDRRDYIEKDFDASVNFQDELDTEIMESFIHSTIKTVNYFRKQYKKTNNYEFFRAMRKCMPMSFQYTISWHSNYAVLRNIWRQRIKRPHRLKEWTEDFALFIDSLPYSKELIQHD